jgi:hypothetical protein
MRKSYLTNEFRNVPTPGTAVMRERRHFFGSKMMEIEDVLRVAGDPFALQLKQRYSTPPALVPNAPASDKASKAPWFLNVDTDAVLEEYLYNQLLAENANDDFTEIAEANLATRKLSDAVLDYVRQNLLSRYQMTKLLLWVRYYPINQPGPAAADGTQALALQYTPVYSTDALPTAAELGAAPAGTDLAMPRDAMVAQAQIVRLAGKLLQVSFKQAALASTHSYAYYFDVVYEKV